MSLKKALKARQKRELESFLLEEYRVSIQRACAVIPFRRQTWYHKTKEKDDKAVRARFNEIAMERFRYGFWWIFTLLKREGWKDNHKRIYRIYCEEQLNLRSKCPKRRKAAAHRQNYPEASNIDEFWNMDFIADQFFDGRRFRALTVVDNYSRQCPLIYVGQSIKGKDVVVQLRQLSRHPKRIKVDNGSEFISRALEKWAYENEVILDFQDQGTRLIIRTLNPSMEVFEMNV